MSVKSAPPAGAPAARIEALHRYTQVQPVSAPPAPATPEGPQ